MKTLIFYLLMVAFFSIENFCMADSLESGVAGLESQTFSESFSSIPQEWLIGFFVFIVACIFLWSLFSQWDQSSVRGSIRLKSLIGGPSANNLFLGLKYTIAAYPNDEKVAYLRSIDTKGAVFVGEEALQKGQRIDLILSSLPNFPVAKTVVRGRVISVQSLGDHSQNVRIKFETDSLESTLSGIKNYIFYLSEPKTVLHKMTQ